MKNTDRPAGNPLRTLLPYCRKYQPLFLWGVVAIGMTTAFQMAGPWYIKKAIDAVSEGVTEGVLAKLAGIYVVLSVLQGIFRYFMRRTIIDASRWIQYELRNDIFLKLQRLSVRYFQNIRTGDILSRATQDLDQVRMVIGPAVMYMVQTIFTVSAAMTLMGSINGKLMIVAMLPMPLMAALVYFLGSEMEIRFAAVQEHNGVISAKVQENLTGIRVVKSYRVEEREIEDFEKMGRHHVYLNLRAVKLYGLVFPLTSMIAAFSLILVLFYGGSLVAQDKITIGSFAAFQAYLLMLTWPVISFGWVLNLYQRGLASMRRINSLLHEVEEIADPPHPVKQPITGAIRFDHMTFGYHPEYPILQDICLDIPAGMTLAVVGPTGSGKSTFAHLVPRLFDVSEGRILADGVDLRDYDLTALREAIAVVPQETFLFSDSVRENVAFGREGAPLEEVDRAVEISQLSRDLPQLPKGLDTLLGERGINLSGGQKQRTGIARAVLCNPKILILDDALSSVDHDTEEAILSRLRGFMASRTTILISHRINTVKDADLIIVLLDGGIAEKGTHRELITQGGYYASLYKRQLLEEELEEIQ